MTMRSVAVPGGITIDLPPGSELIKLGDRTQVVWSLPGEDRTFTVSFTDAGRAVTQWFRLPESWPLLVNKIRATAGSARVYLGGVATGEEAYSLAMLLEAANVDARITATDINPDVLEMAEAGLYTPQSVNQATLAGVMPPTDVMRFFRPHAGRLRVVDSIRRRVSFEPADLKVAELPAADVVVLRNVWRHLGLGGITHLGRQVSESLPDYGVLSVGGADLFDENGSDSHVARVLRAVGIEPVGVASLFYRRARPSAEEG